MRNEHEWQPTKFRWVEDRLVAGSSVGPSSRLAAELVARAYGHHTSSYAAGVLADLGCGGVPLYSAYRPHVDQIVCADWPKSKHGLRHVDIGCDLSQPLPFASSGFDTVVLSDVLEHVPEPSALWQELRRIVRSGGHVILNTPFLYWLHEQPHDYHRFTRHALRHLAEANGFEVMHLEALGGSVEVGLDFIGKHLSAAPLVGTWLARVLQSIGIWWSRTAPGRNLIRFTGDRFPLAYFMVARREA